MTITVLLDNLPNRLMPQEDFDNSMAQVMTDLPLWGSQANALLATMSAIAAGGGLSLGYGFSNTITDTDPGAGMLSLNNATQNLATVLRVDLTSGGQDVTAVLDSFDDSNSIVKGQIKLVSLDDLTKWMVLNLTAIASPAGYRNFTVAVIGFSSTSPFVTGESLALMFTRTGDIGTPGTVVPRVSSITSSATPTPNAATDDQYNVTALAVSATFGIPTGSPYEGQKLLVRIKDNGTARTLFFNSIFRVSSDLLLPSTTVINKTLYIGFIYNAIDTKWDLLGVLNNV